MSQNQEIEVAGQQEQKANFGASIVGVKHRTVLSNVFGNTIAVDVFECGSVALYMREDDRIPLYFANPQQTEMAADVLNSLDFFTFDLTYSAEAKAA